MERSWGSLSQPASVRPSAVAALRRRLSFACVCLCAALALSLSLSKHSLSTYGIPKVDERVRNKRGRWFVSCENIPHPRVVRPSAVIRRSLALHVKQEKEEEAREGNTKAFLPFCGRERERGETFSPFSLPKKEKREGRQEGKRRRERVCV